MNKKQSTEDYLESIFHLSQQKDNVRAIDVVNDLHFSKPSVSIALKKLVAQNYITVDPKGKIELTELGHKVASDTYHRHQLLAQFLMNIGVDEETAYSDACKIEHDLSDITFKMIENHVSKLK